MALSILHKLFSSETDYNKYITARVNAGKIRFFLQI